MSIWQYSHYFWSLSKGQNLKEFFSGPAFCDKFILLGLEHFYRHKGTKLIYLPEKPISQFVHYPSLQRNLADLVSLNFFGMAVRLAEILRFFLKLPFRLSCFITISKSWTMDPVNQYNSQEVHQNHSQPGGYWNHYVTHRSLPGWTRGIFWQFHLISVHGVALKAGETVNIYHQVFRKMHLTFFQPK